MAAALEDILECAVIISVESVARGWPRISYILRVYTREVYIFGMDIAQRLQKASGFQWDAGNAEKNWLSHQVRTSECEQAFFNQPLIVVADVAHSEQEERFFVLGQTDAGREMFLVFTLRVDQIRVVSARDMSRNERKVYRSHV